MSEGALTSDYDYSLPHELIAQYPCANRAESRLLILHKQTSNLSDGIFNQIGRWLKPVDLLVMNDVRVLPARLFGRRQTGGKVELLLEQILSPRLVLVQLKSNRGIHIGEDLCFEERVNFTVAARREGFFELEYHGDLALEELFETIGRVPLPPYIQRPDEEQDRETYQTVYARKAGAVAAPTAGLHFTQELLAELQQAGIAREFITLNVGAGTFRPVKHEDPDLHVMHTERFAITDAVCRAVEQCRQRGGRVIAVGTTSVRALESAATSGRLQPCETETNMFIRPGFQFRVVDGLITNFHLPRSTLLMLVSAFAGYRLTMAAYQHAIRQRYRFFSYGDAMLILD